MALVGDCVLAVTESVPELDCAVAGAGDDLTVVRREGDGEDVVGVADETAGGDTGGELPQAESLVPGGGERVGTVGGDDLSWRILGVISICHATQRPGCTYTVRDDVVVAVKRTLGVAVVSTVLTGEVPDDQALVARGRKEHVGAAIQVMSAS